MFKEEICSCTGLSIKDFEYDIRHPKYAHIKNVLIIKADPDCQLCKGTGLKRIIEEF